MLVGRRVEDQVRPVRIQQVIHPLLVPHGPDAHLQRQLRVLPAQLHLNVVGVVFVNVEDHQPPGPVPGDLTAQLAADAAAASGDQNRLVVDIAADLLQVHLDGVPAQQVLQLHPAELADGDLTVDQLIHARHHLDLAAGGAAYIEDLLPSGALKRRNGEHDLVDIELPGGLGNVPPRTHNAHTLQNAAPLGGVVVDDAGHPAVEMTADGVFPDQLPPGLACADDHDVFRIFPGQRRPVAQVPHPAIEKADAGGAEEAEEQAPHIIGPGHMHPKQRHACKAQPAQKHIGQYDPHQRVHADEPPDAVVQVAQPEHRQADRHPPPDGVQVSVHKLLGNIRKVEVEPCPQGQQVRAHDADDVRHHDQEHPGQPPAIHFSYVQAHPAAPPFPKRSHPSSASSFHMPPQYSTKR